MTVVENQIALLEKELDHLYLRRNAMRLESAKSYADVFLRKLEADGIPFKVGLQAIRDLAKLNPPV
jgi:hypothetical protein